MSIQLKSVYKPTFLNISNRSLQYMLEAIGAGNPDYKGQNRADVWVNSPESNGLKDRVAAIVSADQAKEGG